MWVDQLCINQLNDNEKTQQVMLMPTIYSNCQEVFCWLSELDARDKEFVVGEREPESGYYFPSFPLRVPYLIFKTTGNMEAVP